MPIEAESVKAPCLTVAIPEVDTPRIPCLTLVSHVTGDSKDELNAKEPDTNTADTKPASTPLTTPKVSAAKRKRVTNTLTEELLQQQVELVGKQGEALTSIALSLQELVKIQKQKEEKDNERFQMEREFIMFIRSINESSEEPVRKKQRTYQSSSDELSDVSD